MDSSSFVVRRHQTSYNRHQEVTQIAIVSQNAGKQCFFVISGRNSGKTTKFSLLFMQNKPNFPKSQMNLSILSKMAYENKSNWTLGENKPNSKPIKANLKRDKMNVYSLIIKDYRKKDDFAVQKNKPNSNPISEKPKMNVNLYVIEDYENETTLRLQKNKANQTQFQNPAPKEREEKKASGKLLKKQFYFLMSQNGPIPHYITRTRILREYSRC